MRRTVSLVTAGARPCARRPLLGPISTVYKSARGKHERTDSESGKGRVEELSGGVVVDRDTNRRVTTIVHESIHAHKHAGHKGHEPLDKRNIKQHKRAHDPRDQRKADILTSSRRKVLIFLHGLGGDARRWVPVFHDLLTSEQKSPQHAEMGGVRVVVPDAPLVPWEFDVPRHLCDFGRSWERHTIDTIRSGKAPETSETLDLGPVPQAWYKPARRAVLDVSDPPLALTFEHVDLTELDHVGFNHSVAIAQALIQKEEARQPPPADNHPDGHPDPGVPPPADIVLAGFGQGAAVASSAVLRISKEQRAPADENASKIVGLATFSGSVWPWSDSEARAWSKDESLNEFPWLAFHGQRDKVISVEDASSAYKKLWSAAQLGGAHLDVSPSDDHTFSPKARDALRDFLLRVFNLHRFEGF